MCLVSELLGVRLWKCGSMADGSAERPILSSCAPAGATNMTASMAVMTRLTRNMPKTPAGCRRETVPSWRLETICNRTGASCKSDVGECLIGASTDATCEPAFPHCNFGCPEHERPNGH